MTSELRIAIRVRYPAVRHQAPGYLQDLSALQFSRNPLDFQNSVRDKTILDLTCWSVWELQIRAARQMRRIH